MSVIQTLVDVQGPGFRDNLAHHAGQIALLRARLAEVATGGRDAHIQRHRERGKLLVRERIDFIVDDGSAFLELAAGGLGSVWQRGAGCGHRHRRRDGGRAALHVHCQRCHRQGRLVLP